MTDTRPQQLDPAGVPHPAAPNGFRSAARNLVRRWGTVTADRRALPDFLVVGTKRGGTTTLFRALQSHPGVAPLFPSRQHTKSPHYFDLHYGRGEPWYRSHFPTVRSLRQNDGQRLTGEASPYYMFHPLAPGRIAADLPAVRLIVLLRNPVDRAASHHWDRLQHGVEQLPFELAVAMEPERLAGERERMVADTAYQSHAYEHFSYLSRGHYAEQVEDLFRRFGQDRVLVLRSEDLYADPQRVYDRTLEFLRLPHHRPDTFGRHHAHEGRPAMPDALRCDLEAYFAPHNDRLARLLGTDVWW